MDLATLHTIVRDTVRRGTEAEPHAEQPDTADRLSAVEQAALRAWRRRLQTVGNDLTQLTPPAKTIYWWI